MALGPISRPRLSWPRSMGTPKMPTGSRRSSRKGGTPRTSRIGRRLEAPAPRKPDGVDPPEEHVGCLVAQHALVVVEVGGRGTALVGEEVPLRVEARCEDGLLQNHPEVHHVYDGLQYGSWYT